MTLPIADHWFASRCFAHEITLIWEPHVDPGIRCNIWHIRGRDCDMLIDSGMGLIRLKENFAGLKEKPVISVASHAHFDHIGGHYEFSERAIHPAEASILAKPTGSRTLADSYLCEEIFTAAPYEKFDPADYKVLGAPPTRLLEDGDFIDLGNRKFEILHLPGHSPGCIALLERETGILFAGDVVYDGPLYDHLYHSDPEVYAESLRLLRKLPVETVHGGHHDSFGRVRMLELIAKYLG